MAPIAPAVPVSVATPCGRLGKRRRERPRGRWRAKDQRTARARQAAARCSVRSLPAELGISVSAVADLLGLASRTARRWVAADPIALLPPRGRRPEQLTPEQRAVILRALRADPLQGVDHLRARYPALPRNALAELVARWKYARRRRRVRRRLTWPHAGTVWAMDASLLPKPLDGLYPYLITVRDMASRKIIAALPAVRESASQTARLLGDLFRQHGAPLLIKRDGGTPFTADTVDKVLSEHRVTPLTSPPYYPPYNGGVERVQGLVKSTLETYATIPGGRWDRAALARALYHLDHRRRPSSYGGPSPARLWTDRAPVHEFERDRFDQVLAEHRRTLHAAENSDTKDELTQDRRRRLERTAIQNTLIDLQYLFIESV